MPVNENYGAPLRLLIIEDVESDALLLVDHLQHEGLALDWQQVDNEEGLISELHETWDIVCSDFTMPNFNGIRALEIVRQHDPDIPFIFVSGTIGEDTAVKALKSGAQDYVIKSNLVRLKPAIDRELRDAQQRRKYRKAEEARARLAAIMEASPDLVTIFEPDGRLQYLNNAGRRLLGLSTDADISQYHAQHLFIENKYQGKPAESFTTAQKGIWNEGFLLRSTGNDNELPVSWVLLEHLGADGNIDFLSIIARDISERKRFEAELQHQATHDRLTGLPNRFFLIDRFTSALEYAQRHGNKVAALFLDLDNFKRINDSMGHAAGDALLRQVALRLQNCLRSNDTVARHGGDEFTIIITDLEHSENIHVVLRKLQTAMQRPIIFKSQEIYVTFSIGIALYPHDGNQIEDLLCHADIAMYQAKITGPNQYRFYASGMNTRSHKLLTLETELRRALEREEFLLHYQPQMDLRSDCITGVEGLIRWQPPAREQVSPADFIPLLESSGMIITVGEWVLRQACMAHRIWRESGHNNIRVSVNVSAAQFNDADLLNKVHHASQEEQMPHQALELEITENILMQDPVKAVEVLQALRALGVRISIDDFGTGYSSLAYLKRFPLDALKIDQTFISDLLKNPSNAAIVEASISLAHKLGLEVIAEGVETVEQLEFLRNSCCDLIQGYYISRPLPGSELMKLLQKK